MALLRVVRHGHGGECGGGEECQIEGSAIDERTLTGQDIRPDGWSSEETVTGRLVEERLR